MLDVLNFILTLFVAIGTVYLIKNGKTLTVNEKEDDRPLIEKLDEIFFGKN